MENARTFVAQQLAAYEVQLREAERRRAEFRARNIDLLPMRRDAARRRLAPAARQAARRARGRADAARPDPEPARRDADRPLPRPDPPALSVRPAANRIAEAERTLRELLLRFTEQHPDVVATRRMIAELRASGGGGGARGGGAAAAPARLPAYLPQTLRCTSS